MFETQKNGDIESEFALPQPPSNKVFAAYTVAVAALAVGVASQDFVLVVDHANLAFHEAGHMAFAFFGEFLQFLGGTIGQFVFPALTTWHFWRRREVYSASACALWFFENFRYTAGYMADARAQQLPLVGGGEHDWAYLFGRLGLLEQDTTIAGLFAFICWAGWLLVWGLMARWWWQGREQTRREAEQQRRAEILALGQAMRERRLNQPDRSNNI